MSCELVGTGWYSSNAARNYIAFGDDAIRGVEFRPLWWRSLDTFVKPQHVLVVDSASPLKPDDQAHTATRFSRLELLVNPGHAQNGATHYCGAMAAIIMGLEFALHNDVDMFVYVEQDALVFGDRIVERTKNALRRHDLVFGAHGRGGQIIQHSYFAANKRGIRQFLRGLHAMQCSDRQIAPEHKFMFAASTYFPEFLSRAISFDNPALVRRACVRLFTAIMSMSKNYALLPFGYGRDRPINFSDDAFYFQQASADEIAQYTKRAGF
ncbi:MULTISPECIES: hypothetical protein [unclassified Janthinobacterium]|uniref:hypothetical protein n=1 Tax=unclassified Janthinobacterium TaxID=2610881 RepID=UPI000345F16B|nr:MULTISPECIES: hypothetical protein [unclassified Janthinobacterium]MEC5163527.1 hypothetical protein [Janthinobacterium sp. CG_S6]